MCRYYNFLTIFGTETNLKSLVLLKIMSKCATIYYEDMYNIIISTHDAAPLTYDSAVQGENSANGVNGMEEELATLATLLQY